MHGAAPSVAGFSANTRNPWCVLMMLRGGSAPRENFFDLLPAQLRHRPRRAAGSGRLLAGGGAVLYAPHDRLKDGGAAEEVVGHAEVADVRRDRVAAGAFAVGRDVLGLFGDS